MSEVCQYWWFQPDPCGWHIGNVWQTWDLIQRAIFLGLVLMLVYTLFFVIRFCYRYYLARCKFNDLKTDDLPDFTRAKSALLADLSPSLGMLRGIAWAAPYLGLAGTCYGVLAGFNIIPGSRVSALGYVVGIVADAPVTTVVGILVAIPAAFSYSLIRTRVETLRGRYPPNRNPNSNDLGSFHFAQTLPLKKRFAGPPQYALLASPVFACVIMVYMAFRVFPYPVGLPVSLPSIHCDDLRNRSEIPDRIIVLQIMSKGDVLINTEPVDWKDLQTRLFPIYAARAHREIYVRAEEGVPFQLVAAAIDIARSSMGPGVQSRDIVVHLITPQVEADSEKCRAVSLDRLGRRFLRK